MFDWRIISVLIFILATPIHARSEEGVSHRLSSAEWSDYFNKISSDPRSIKIHEDSRSIVFAIYTERVIYFFSKIGNDAHPCVVKRKVVQNGASVILETEGFYAGSKEAFDKLIRSFEQQVPHLKNGAG